MSRWGRKRKSLFFLELFFDPAVREKEKNETRKEKQTHPFPALHQRSLTLRQRVRSVNYFGFENGMTMVDGLWANTRDALIADFATVVWRMKLLGINAVRLPFSFLEFSKTPQSIVWPSCGGIDPNRVRSNVIPPGMNVPASAVPPPLPTAANVSRTPGVCNQYVYSQTTRGRLLWVTKFLADNGFYVILDDHLVSEQKRERRPQRGREARGGNKTHPPPPQLSPPTSNQPPGLRHLRPLRPDRMGKGVGSPRGGRRGGSGDEEPRDV